jgi:hypothetical protein
MSRDLLRLRRQFGRLTLQANKASRCLATVASLGVAQLSCGNSYDRLCYLVAIRGTQRIESAILNGVQRSINRNVM